MACKLMIFDWDGTLMDSTGRIVASMQQVATILGLPIPDAEAVKAIIGISLGPAIDRLFPGLNEVQVNAFVDEYREEYVNRNPEPTPLFDGVHAMLANLEEYQVPMAVATGKARRGLVRAFAQTGLERRFVASICADEAKSKPDPDMLLRLLQQFDVDAQDAVMIGDSRHDMAMAAAIDMPRIGVSFGAAAASELAAHAPLAVVDSIPELQDQLLNLCTAGCGQQINIKTRKQLA